MGDSRKRFSGDEGLLVEALLPIAAKNGKSWLFFQDHAKVRDTKIDKSEIVKHAHIVLAARAIDPNLCFKKSTLRVVMSRILAAQRKVWKLPKDWRWRIPVRPPDVWQGRGRLLGFREGGRGRRGRRETGRAISSERKGC